VNKSAKVVPAAATNPLPQLNEALPEPQTLQNP
jgi:hypothetical protein